MQSELLGLRGAMAGSAGPLPSDTLNNKGVTYHQITIPKGKSLHIEQKNTLKGSNLFPLSGWVQSRVCRLAKI